MASTLKSHTRIVVLVALGTTVALTLFALMSLGVRAPATAHAAVKQAAKHSVRASDPDTAQVGDQTSPDPAGGSAKTAATSDPAGNSQGGGTDTTSANDPAGNSQAGGPDTGASSGESTTEAEQGQPGEPATGNADPAGAAGSNCDGNCVQ